MGEPHEGSLVNYLALRLRIIAQVKTRVKVVV
jgi:hypothetical protein